MRPHYGNHTGDGYISSNGKNFYRSDPWPGDYPLKAKYRAGGSAPNWNRHSDNRGVNKQKAVKKAVHPNQLPKVMVMANAYAGKVRMEYDQP